MPAPALIAFDLDDTLAPSKSPMPAPMAGALVALLDHLPVCIISGGHFGQFRDQVLAHLPATPEQARPAAPDADLRHPLPPPRRRRVAAGVRPRPHRRGARRGPGLRRGRGPAPGPVDRAAVGRHPRGPRLADHLLRPGPAGPARREEGLGPHRRQEDSPARRRRAPPARAGGPLRRVHLGGHHPEGRGQGLRHGAAERADRHRADRHALRRRPAGPGRQRLSGGPPRRADAGRDRLGGDGGPGDAGSSPRRPRARSPAPVSGGDGGRGAEPGAWPPRSASGCSWIRCGGRCRPAPSPAQSSPGASRGPQASRRRARRRRGA